MQSLKDRIPVSRRNPLITRKRVRYRKVAANDIHSPVRVTAGNRQILEIAIRWQHPTIQAPSTL